MSRRIEITVPNDWAEAVRKCLEDKDMCNLGDHSEKLNMIVELAGYDKTIFLVTVPGAGVGTALEALRKNGFGVKVGRIIINSLEYMKPDLSKPLIPLDLLDEEDRAIFGRKAKGLKGIAQFIKARRTTEELFAEISNNASMTINTWLNLIGASVMAAGGLATNTTVFIVAAMLVSPIMGPILGMTFGYRVADWPLFKAGFWSEVKMVATCFFTGIFCGFILGSVGDTYNWPTSAMLGHGQGYQLIISIIVSAAAGMVLAVSLSSPATNALVGTAISAGLLPPLVNCGMLISYSMTYAPKDRKYEFYEMGSYSFVFYLTHVFTIIIVANLVFWLKDIDPRFRQGDDADFDDIPSLREHKEKMKKMGETTTTGGEKVKFKNFMSHAFSDLKTDATDGFLDIKDGAFSAVNRIKGVFTGDGLHGAQQAPTTEIPEYEIDPETGGLAEVKTQSNAMLFKRHKIHASPNLLAEAELEATAVPTIVPTSMTSKLPSSSSARYTSVKSTAPEESPVSLSLSQSTVVNPIFTQLDRQQQQQSSESVSSSQLSSSKTKPQQQPIGKEMSSQILPATTTAAGDDEDSDEIL